MNVKELFIPKYFPEDTRLDQVQYNKPSLIIVMGRVYKRHYNTIICSHKDCDKQVLARFYANKDGTWRIEGDQSHAKRKFCGYDCANKGRKQAYKPPVVRHANTKIEGYHGIAWTKLQDLKYKLYVARL